MSMLERTLNFAHTGSGKVLSRKLMLPFFLSLGILHDGAPCLNKAFLSYKSLFEKRQVIINSSFWPRTPKPNKRPIMGSLRVQELTYGKLHSQVSLFPFHHAPWSNDPMNESRPCRRLVPFSFLTFDGIERDYPYFTEITNVSKSRSNFDHHPFSTIIKLSPSFCDIF